MAGVLDPYKNQYTTFTYDPYVMVAIDGLEYYRTRDTLYVNYVAGNSGYAYALADGNLTLANGAQVDLGSVSSAIVSEGITSIGVHFFYGLNLKTVTLNCNDASDNGSVFEGDYSAMIVDSRFQPGTYVYADGVWRELSAAAFSIIISPGGGTFGDEFGNLTPPQIRLTSTSVRSLLGKVTTTHYQNEFEDMIIFTGRDNVTYYLWYYFTETVVELTVDITSMPTKLHNSIIPPSGCDEVDAWEMQAPYMPIQKGVAVTELVLSRANCGIVRQTIVYPSWTLVRDERVRAVLCAPGYGTLDFGVLQKVSTTYNSKMSVLPIVCYGYSGTFCIDLGVTKTIDISYVRVSPEKPNNEIQDSRLWDNATWVKRLREFTDRWQMRTNGNRLYLKRPDVERLYEYDSNETEHDPMIDYIEEIHGENCYIASAPITYKEGTPHTISGTISLKMGTLYPKQTPPRMMQLIYKLEADPSIIGSMDMDYYFQFPVGITSQYPQIPYDWHLFKGADGNYYTVVDLLRDGEKVYAGGNFTPESTSPIVVKAVLRSISEDSVRFVTDSTNFRLTPYEGSDGTVTINVTLVGGGGGGGGGAFFKGFIYFGGRELFTRPQERWVTSGSGGAGGASGQWSSNVFVRRISTDVDPANQSILSVIIGDGGNGGSTAEAGWGGSAVGSDGNRGNPSFVELSGVRLITANGGVGGPGAPDTQHGGTWSSESISPSPNSYRGGNGGKSKRDMVTDTWMTGTPDTDGGDPGIDGVYLSKYGPGYGGEHQEGGQTSEIPSYWMYYGGGGGGGNSPKLCSDPIGIYIPNEQRAGNGIGPNNDPNTRDGKFGGGGGGGSYRYETKYAGGKGGKGAALIIVVGATMTVV